jgi:formate C-acetyltransferase
MLPDSIGTVDRYLWEYYKKDIESGAMTRDEAKEYLQELFLRLQSATPFESGNRKKGGQSHFAIGGYLPDGSDGFTELSRLIVEALLEIPSHIPQFSLRYTKKTPVEVLRFVMDAERHDPYKRIAFVNDDPRIKGFMEYLGMSWEDAISYTMVGCNEPAFPGGVWLGGITTNIARSLTKTLYDRKEEALTCRDFDSFYRLYEHALVADMEEIFRYLEFYNRLRARDLNVLSSLFLDGCIENAESATRGGCRIRVGGPELMGLVCVIDSLSIIKQFVFDEKRVGMKELLDALRNNWEGYEDLHTEIMKKGRFFGNGDDLSDGMAQRFSESVARICKGRRLEMDISVLCGNLAGYHPHYTTYGKTTLATPDGRHAGDPFMVGIGQSGGKDREGLTALLSSVAGFDPYGVFCGPTVTNVLLDEAMMKVDANFEKVVGIVDTYFKMGGLHVQLNYVSKETLLDAKAHPENHGALKVRVSGFSGVFVELQEEIQENVIERTSVGR